MNTNINTNTRYVCYIRHNQLSGNKWKLIPDPFLKNENWGYLWINSIIFYCIRSWGLSKYTETKLQTTCLYLKLSFSKKGLELVFLLCFLNNFWRKIFFFIYFINWPSFIVWFSLLREILANVSVTLKSKWQCISTINFYLRDISTTLVGAVFKHRD